ncbi:Phosphatidylinositol N-acetylglucosaminyltransferase GPI3 subunit [Microbotryomycetes sp. JL221]|nr:Phosphatidylinositol N-acetylglucosaminyltransferase GPI3 subunit [Microbotryomycetes sp. JL221]
MLSPNIRPLNIALVSDYFYPKVGGVESHIYSGVRYLPYGIKVYSIPIQQLPPEHVQATLPNFFTALPLLRNIMLREQIDILHAHAALSAEGMEGIIHARTLGIKAVFTDHSLFGLGNMAEIWGNKMLKGCLSDVEAVICVSHTGKENTVLRGALNPSIVHVIPNAVVASHFRPPDPPQPVPETITIVCITRLVYRKGIDLLIAALPKICAQNTNVRILIGGDGPKIVELDQMRDKHQALLRDRVELLGPVRHENVQGIFLNPSLTEAFGIGILEAACAGLFVVSTRVGGVPEVLPPGLVEFAEPEVDDLVRAVCRAIEHVRSGQHDPWQAHTQLKEMYSWADVAERTEKVYYDAMTVPDVPVVERLRRYYGTGAIFGKILCIVICVDYVCVALLDYFFPREDIDLAPKFGLQRWQELCDEQVNSTGSILDK